MPIEIEKKYRLTKKQCAFVRKRLKEIGATYKGEEFEENTLYRGGDLEIGRSVLRLRRTGESAILAYKERFPSRSTIRRQREEETRVDDSAALNRILRALGFKPALVYEKRRETWVWGKSEIVLDKLPFGLFMEIEGSKAEIIKTERRLAIEGLRAEPATYPQLAVKHGNKSGGVLKALLE